MRWPYPPRCPLQAARRTWHQPPGIGRCDHHGGATPTHEEHARQVLLGRAEQSALAELRHLGVPPMGNPLEALCELAAEARHWERILRRQVAELESLTAVTPAGAEQARAVVTLFERAMDRAAAFTAMLARLNIDDRIVEVGSRISRAQGEQIADVIIRVLVKLGHPDPRTDPALGALVAAELRRLDAAEEEER
jgi:hypothetical protein